MPTPTAVSTGSPHIDAALAATGFRWSVVQDYKVIDVTGKLQHRRDEGLNMKYVRSYVNKFKAGSRPPFLCVTQDGLLVFGNHRLEAAKIAGWDMVPMIVIEVEGVGADEHVENQLLSVAYAENAPHGVPYSAADKTEAAKHLIKLSYTNSAIQAELGLSGPTVSNIKRDVEIAKRFARLGISSQGIAVGILRSLAGPDATALNDDPFRQLVALSKDAGLTGAEINALAKEAKAAGSDVASLDLIEKRRTSNGMPQRIAQVNMGGVPRPTPVGRLKGALKGVLALCDASTNPNTYREHGDAVAVQELIDMLDQSLACLTGIRGVQELPQP